MKRVLAGSIVAILLLCGAGLFDFSPDVVAAEPQDDYLKIPLTDDGWFDLTKLLVASDGTRSLGNHRARLNDARDKGSKIVFFDPAKGNNDMADVYWWDGRRMIDSKGSPTNPDNGKPYGDDPLHPNEDAIRPFKEGVGMVRNAEADPRLRTSDRDCSAVAGGYPDWYLYRRGRTHDIFDSSLVGGRSEREPMVVAAYGPAEDGRAIFDPAEGKQVEFNGRSRNVCNPMSCGTKGAKVEWMHMVYSGLDVKSRWSALGANVAESFSGGPLTAYAEDCRWAYGEGGRLTYLPRKTVLRRCVIAFSWSDRGHNQGYFTSGYDAATTFDEVILYRNGFKSDPRTEPDPRRDIFSRNIYQGGGARMGHQYLGIISADGGSGGPQMRFSGRMENSLVIEGYWYSSTNSNKLVNPWLIESGQKGQSALVRNNVQLVFAFPTPNDPDTAVNKSQTASQPAWGYALSAASFGAVVEGNIVSQAMLIDDLGVKEASRGHGYALDTRPDEYEDGNKYAMQNCTMRDNIAYRTGVGLQIGGDWSQTNGVVFEDNVLVADKAVNLRAEGVAGPQALSVRNNRIYANGDTLADAAFAQNNKVAAYADAAKTEGWPDPNRTLKRYVTEVLGLKLLDWKDDPYVDAAGAKARADAGEAYDPTGMKTFMAVATNMRRGGTEAAPRGEKPSWTGDYAWDQRFTGPSVVN